MKNVLVAALAAIVVCVPVLAGEGGLDGPSYPVPRKWKKTAGTLRLDGMSVFVPSDASGKVTAVAEALRQRLKLITGVDMQLRKAAAGPEGTAVLCVSRGVPVWKQALAELDLKTIPPLVADQGYALRIGSDGIVAASPSGRGLSYAAVTVMDLARRADGGALPCMDITDWPDMPVRAFYGTHVFRSGTVSLDRMQEIAAWAPMVKQNMLVLDIDTGAFKLDSHPEFYRKQSWDRKEYVDMARLLPAGGIEVTPWVQMGKSIATRFGCPYAPLDDDDPVYLWAYETVADEMLEVFLPRILCVGMNEDWHSKFGRRNRDKKQWRDAFIRFSEFLRRRGVSGMAVADNHLGPTGLGYHRWGKEVKKHGLALRYQPDEFYVAELAKVGLTPDDVGGIDGAIVKHKRAVYPSKPKDSMSDADYQKCMKALMDEFHAYARSFPVDVVLLPKQSNPPQVLAFRNVASSGCRTIVFSPYVRDAKGWSGVRGNNGLFVYAAVKYLRDNENAANLTGTLVANFGGGFFSIGGIPTLSFLRGAGPVWNIAGTTKGFRDKTERYFKKPSRDEMKYSLEWRVLLDADPRGTVAEAIARVKGDTWRWTDARDDLVARGMPVVPALLGEMKKAGGEIRQRFEGCVSRIARDARNGVDRGALDMSAVEPMLADAGADLAYIAAEAIGASGDAGAKRLIAGLRKPGEAAACAWALAYMKDTDSGAALCAAVGSTVLPARARANAARAAGMLRLKNVAGPLAKLIETESDPAAQREAAWALALLGARDKDASIGKLLSSPDGPTRCRAALALAVLQSKEVLKAGPMLTADNANEAWCALWALYPAHVFDYHIASGKSKDRESGVKLHKRLWLDVYNINETVPRDEAKKLLAAAVDRIDEKKSSSHQRLRDCVKRILKGKVNLKYLK